MKIKTQLLAEALKDLKPFIDRSGHFFVLKCAKIVTGDSMQITATNLDEMAGRTLEFNGEADVFCVSFAQLEWSLGDADETMLVREGEKLVIRCGNKVSRLGLLNHEDFPASPVQKDFKAIGVNCEDLADAIKAVSGFAHKDRDPLTNVVLRGSPKMLECFATNGANLAYFSQPSICSSFEVLLPARFADALQSALRSKDAVLKLTENKALVTWEDGFFTCQLGEGKFSSLDAFFSLDIPRLGKLNTKPLLREAEACIALTDPARAAALNLKFDVDSLHTEFGGTNDNQFAGEFAVYKCTVNAKSLKLCLSAIGESCDIFGDGRMIKMVNGDLAIFSTLMLA